MKKVLLMLTVIIFVLTGCSPENEEVKAKVQEQYGENRIITTEFNEGLSAVCSNGTYVGTEDGKVISYKGIPYAEQPVGELRWKPPVPAEDDSGIYEAYYFGKAPVQSEWLTEPGSYYKQGEDCLYLNVWTNSSNLSANKPVMVFFHGGSYGWGSTADPMYNGHNLVEKFDDIILVTVGYRTGLLGFIDFSFVEGGEEYEESGNLGLLDQVEALRWIQKNISAFGGDPDNVTIFGESAGGGCVSLLPLIDGTDGLFRRIIAQSGSVALTFSTEECRNLTELLLKDTGCSTVDELVELPTEKIIEFNETLNDSNNFPERDGIVLPEDLYSAYENGATAKYDMLIGSNADETRYWITEMGYTVPVLPKLTVYSELIPVMYENNIAKISDDDMQYIDSFMDSQNDKRIWNLTEFYNEVLFRIPALKQAEEHAENGGRAFVYHWTYPGADEILGACHAIELPYVFNNLDETICTGGRIDEQLADTVQNMWVNFARTGDPSTPGTEWPAYTAETRYSMLLGEQTEPVSDYKKSQRENIEPLLSYCFNGCYSQLSYNVPQVYKTAGIILGLLAVIVIAIVSVIKKIRKRRSGRSI